MIESTDGVFLDLKISDKVTAEEVSVGIILQAMSEYQMLPLVTPAIHGILLAFQNKIMNPVFVREQQAKMQEQQHMAESMEQGFMQAMKEQGVVKPPLSAEDLLPPD